MYSLVFFYIITKYTFFKVYLSVLRNIIMKVVFQYFFKIILLRF